MACSKCNHHEVDMMLDVENCISTADIMSEIIISDNYIAMVNKQHKPNVSNSV